MAGAVAAVGEGARCNVRWIREEEMAGTRQEAAAWCTLV